MKQPASLEKTLSIRCQTASGEKTLGEMMMHANLSSSQFVAHGCFGVSKVYSTKARRQILRYSGLGQAQSPLGNDQDISVMLVIKHDMNSGRVRVNAGST